jgi:glycosyltransferase involved in cell wall biosynthesis
VSDPELSVVVASVNGFPYLGACLDSLRDRCPRAQVIVADCTDAATRQRVRDGWPFVTLLAFTEPTSVPALRAAGIFEATSPCVAVIEDHCVILAGWQAALLAAQEAGHRVVGGPIRNGLQARLRDWPAFLFEYSAFIEPVERGLATDLPGMNVCYDRDAVEAIDDLLREGRWESWLHRRLRERGFDLFCEPNAVIEHEMDFGVREFVAQRFHYSRAHADMRNPELGWRRVVYFCGSPLLVPLLYWRVARNVFRKRQHRVEFVLGSPLLLLYVAVTAVGEAVGYALGGGRSLLRVR